MAALRSCTTCALAARTRRSTSLAVTVTSPAASSERSSFFIQAEDSIRCRDVTGVQTCALPISSRWLGWGFWPKYAGFGPLAGHLRYVERGARRLARGVFHAMMRFGPKLEYRQAVLFRLVDAGAELFAMTAACARAQWLLKQDPAVGRRAVELADLFCRQARARIETTFKRLWRNDDVRAYRVAQEVLKGEHRWLERGMVEMD